MRYLFLIDTYATESLKVLSVWAMFADTDLRRRPHPTDPRGRNLIEQMTHQCVSENLWFAKMLGISVTEQPLPAEPTRLGFMRQYATDSATRLARLRDKDEAWWEEETAFFETRRSRAWILTRRIAHTAHHRGQLTTLLRELQRPVYSTYGPTADTGGLPRDGAPTIYAYPDVAALLAGEAAGGKKALLPDVSHRLLTERPEEEIAP